MGKKGNNHGKKKETIMENTKTKSLVLTAPTNNSKPHPHKSTLPHTYISTLLATYCRLVVGVQVRDGEGDVQVTNILHRHHEAHFAALLRAEGVRGPLWHCDILVFHLTEECQHHLLQLVKALCGWGGGGG